MSSRYAADRSTSCGLPTSMASRPLQEVVRAQSVAGHHACTARAAAERTGRPNASGATFTWGGLPRLSV
ncbi:hypothetical protein ABZV75_13595 [Streptomyces flaveolus]|uniref:hypothetical protein n=1 Tax=Streptomyces flaveolus TaxID=67297 RepID=UPI0033BAC881